LGSAVVCSGASAFRFMKPGAFHTLEHMLHLITYDGKQKCVKISPETSKPVNENSLTHHLIL